MPTQEPTREEVVTKTLDTLDRPDITHPADINNLMTSVGLFPDGTEQALPKRESDMATGGTLSARV